MCGIAGYSHHHKTHDPDRMRSIVAALHHRGPDQHGVFENETISLGAVRLKIIDLAGGDQPIVSDCGNHVIAFNGEIYNHQAIRDELIALGHRFHSQCDTEVVLHALMEWDRAALAKLRGMFALAYWRSSDRRLLLARDRLGIKPLYFLHQNGQIYFGSELKTLFAHPEIDRRLDRAGLNYFLLLNYIPCPHTLVKGIRKVPPAHGLIWRDGAIESFQYWKNTFQPDPNLSVEDAKTELDSLLRESVREHLVSDVPLGVWASGGLDSSAILHYAAELSSSRLKTFSVSFQGQSHDESRYFREVAAHYGTEHTELDLNPEADIVAAVEAMVEYSDEPSAYAGALPVWFLSKLTREQVTVTLSGDGADELFGGYMTYLANSYARQLRRIPAPLLRISEKMLEYWPVSDNKISFEYKLKRMIKGSLLPADQAHFFWNGTFSEEERRGLLVGDGHTSVSQLVSALSETPRHFEGRYLFLDQHYYLADDILYKCDRMSMAHSLEVRPPFLDHRIVEFASRLPNNFKIRGSQLKWLLREVMRDKLPTTVLTRRKEGFDIPTHAWFRSVLRRLLLETVNRETVQASGLFHWRNVERLISDHLNRRINVGYHLWGLLTLFLWMKRWNIQSAAIEGDVR